MRALIVIFVSISALFCIGQDIAVVAKDRSGYFYYRFPNEVKIIIEGLACDEYEVIAEKAVIERNGCNITVFTLTQDFYIYLYLLHNNKIDTIWFYNFITPDPGYGINILTPRSPYYKFNYIVVGNEEFKINYSVVSFVLTFMRGDSVLYRAVKECGDFSQMDYEQSRQLESEDKIIIEDLIVIGSDGLMRKLKKRVYNARRF